MRAPGDLDFEKKMISRFMIMDNSLSWVFHKTTGSTFISNSQLYSVVAVIPVKVHGIGPPQ